jgi:enoyl-CoA hydratase/carnithine racemase
LRTDASSAEQLLALEHHQQAAILRLVSADSTNRLTRARVDTLTEALERLTLDPSRRLALVCTRRIASPSALFAHRGAALGLITGWGGTQRLPRLIGKGRALQMFLAAEKVPAARALQIGLVDAIADDPLLAALEFP